ncbi:MAG: carboxypeptidase regulatory-like domain-containing protein [Bryobacteraceae bacterium]
MTWLWRICFSGLWLLPVWGGSVQGTVVLTDSRDPSVRKNRDFKDVVVWLESVDGDPPLRIPVRHFRMAQKNKHFTPHVLAIPVGATVDFPNQDPIFHNVFSNYNGQIFDLSLYKPNTSRDVVFKRVGIVRVFCNIHPTMSAIIAVLDTPWFAVTDATGSYTMRDVPPGSYKLHIFHERATDETLNALVQQITVDSAARTLLSVRISETGYIPAPHKNKYERDYPPATADQPAYQPNE